ncbi:MAG: hypothetical protein LBR08_02135, partial [Bacteroidales bacterium]|nr:hypothetical protein [Bacteroidales bacterium]
RFTSMQGCAQPRQGLPFDNPVQAKRSAGYENSKLNRMQYIQSIICDGKPGMFALFPDIPI